MNKGAKIYVAGHTGLLGSAVVRELRKQAYRHIIAADHKDLDLTQQSEVNEYFNKNEPDYVFLCAGKVGGIHANDTQRAEFIYQNLMIQANIIHAAYVNNVTKLLATGSSCIYPKESAQPIIESYLLTGKLEATNISYAVSKIAAIEMCEAYRAQYGCNFISAMPTNLYGPGDHYDLPNAHVLPSLIARFHSGKLNYDPSVTIWGTGEPRREFLYVDDCAEALVFLMNNYDEPGHVNVGSGEDIKIQELAMLVSAVVGYDGRIENDISKPDGMLRKLLDSSKINAMGWKPKTDLRTGIELAYKYYKTH